MNWEPIETAPKNNRVLLYIPSYKGDKVWTGIWAAGWITSYELRSNEQPTHWMPLPPPPTEEPKP